MLGETVAVGVAGDGWAVPLGTVVAGSDGGGVGLAVVTVVDGTGGKVVASTPARTADASDEQAVIRPADLPRKAVIDLVYATGGTPLVAAARAAGLPAADGWTVLLAQGAASFTGWTSSPAPLEAMRAALPT